MYQLMHGPIFFLNFAWLKLSVNNILGNCSRWDGTCGSEDKNVKRLEPLDLFWLSVYDSKTVKL